MHEGAERDDMGSAPVLERGSGDGTGEVRRSNWCSVAVDDDGKIFGTDLRGGEKVRNGARDASMATLRVGGESVAFHRGQKKNVPGDTRKRLVLIA